MGGLLFLEVAHYCVCSWAYGTTEARLRTSGMGGMETQVSIVNELLAEAVRSSWAGQFDLHLNLSK
jgi:hypothetical protein